MDPSWGWNYQGPGSGPAHPGQPPLPPEQPLPPLPEGDTPEGKKGGPDQNSGNAWGSNWSQGGSNYNNWNQNQSYGNWGSQPNNANWGQPGFGQWGPSGGGGNPNNQNWNQYWQNNNQNPALQSSVPSTDGTDSSTGGGKQSSQEFDESASWSCRLRWHHQVT